MNERKDAMKAQKLKAKINTPTSEREEGRKRCNQSKNQDKGKRSLQAGTTDVP
jgi:hypothetical protein